MKNRYSSLSAWVTENQIWNYTALVWGLVIWFVMALLPEAQFSLGIFEKIFLFSPLVLVAMALLALKNPDHNNNPSPLLVLATLTQPFCALAAVLSFLIQTGPLAGILACLWFLETILIALLGLSQLSQQKLEAIEEVCINFGLIYLAIGGGWLVLSRFGLRPLGFDETIVFLTAMHFHYAGFAAPLIAGFAGRFLQGRRDFLSGLHSVSVIGIVSGIPLLAMGITLSPSLEFLAALILAASLILLAFLIAGRLIPCLRSKPLILILLLLCCLSIIYSMSYALLYAYGEFSGTVLVSIPQMARTHGIANAFGFSGCGFLAFTLIRPLQRIPHSKNEIEGELPS